LTEIVNNNTDDLKVNRPSQKKSQKTSSSESFTMDYISYRNVL